MSDKHNRFMAELRELLGRYEAKLWVDVHETVNVEYDSEGHHPVCSPAGLLDPTPEPERRDIPTDNQIKMFFHCGLCLQEWEAHHRGNISPKDFSRTQSGWTKLGLQVWCHRHEVNIVHIDFNGMKMRANTTMKTDEEA